MKSSAYLFVTRIKLATVLLRSTRIHSYVTNCEFTQTMYIQNNSSTKLSIHKIVSQYKDLYRQRITNPNTSPYKITQEIVVRYRIYII